MIDLRTSALSVADSQPPVAGSMAARSRATKALASQISERVSALMTDHAGFMRLALAEGRKALPHCRPNPPVGCVLVRGGEVIARGFTQPPGHHHAEAMALSQIAGDLSDVTAYVTLEPCSFHGRTPSCALALVSRRIKQVFVATLDPDPRNAGAGIALMRDAGVDVSVGLLEAEALADLAPYLWSESAGETCRCMQSAI